LIKLEKGEVTGLQSAIRELNQIDRDIVKQLRADMKSAIAPDAKALANKVTQQPPLSGFNNNGPKRWTGAKSTVSVTPSRIRKGKDVHPIVTIRLMGRAKGAGFDIAEKAGMRNLRYSSNRQRGQQFIRALDKRAPFKFKGGRFAYGFFLDQRKGINKKAVKIIDSFAKKFNRKVSR